MEVTNEGGKGKNVAVVVVLVVVVLGVAAWFLAGGVGTNGGPGNEPEASVVPQKSRLEVTHEAIGANDIEVCEQLANADDRSLCAFSFTVNRAKVENNIAICDGFATSGEAQQCRDQVVVYRAISAQDVGICAQVTNEDLAAQCVSNITGR